MDAQSHRSARPACDRATVSGTCGRPACRCAAAAGRAKGRQIRQFRRRCPPTPGQIRQFRRARCPPTRAPARAPSASACEPLSRADRGGAGSRAQRHGDLAGPRRRSRLHRAVRERPPLRRAAARRTAPPEARVVITTAPGEEGQVDYGERADGARPEHRQVPADAALCPDAGLLAQSACGC